MKVFKNPVTGETFEDILAAKRLYCNTHPCTSGGCKFHEATNGGLCTKWAQTLSFEKGGGSKTVDIEASGAFSAGKAPAGFTLEVVNGRITVTASSNSGAARNGTVEFTLASDASKKATLTLNQAAGNV